MRTPDDQPLPLTVARPADAPEPHPVAPPTPARSWLLVAIGWTVGAVVLGWALVGVLVAAAWLTAPRLAAGDVVTALGQFWLAAHGVRAGVGGVVIDLIPLGLTLPVVVAVGLVAHHASRQRAVPGGPWRAWASVVAACVLTYVVSGAVVTSVVGSAGQAGEALLGLSLTSLAGAAPGAWLGLGLDPLAGRPAWLARLPRAVGLGLGVLGVGSSVAAAAALASGWSRVAALHEALAPDAVASALLVLVQLCWWPTLLIWAGSYTLGAGVQVGAGTVAAPGLATIGPLPGVPVLGALPVAASPFDWAWLLVGVLAGAVAGWWVVRPRGTVSVRPLIDAAWQGALGGLLVGAAWVVLGRLASGDLGDHRLAGVGPRFPELFGWALLPLAAAGALAAVGWVAWHGRRTAEDRPTTESIG